MSVPDRRAKLDEDQPVLSIPRQCAMLGVARSGMYRQYRPANDNDLDLMRRIDELFLGWPLPGSRRMVALLAADGIRVNRKRAQRLMGIVPPGPKPRTSKPGAGQPDQQAREQLDVRESGSLFADRRYPREFNRASCSG